LNDPKGTGNGEKTTGFLAVIFFAWRLPAQTTNSSIRRQ
jgi:hypothetical protein